VRKAWLDEALAARDMVMKMDLNYSTWVLLQ
jgi:hypothetical protein